MGTHQKHCGHALLISTHNIWASTWKKPTIRLVQPAKTLTSHAVWSESSLIAYAFYSPQAIQRGISENLSYWVDVQAELSLCQAHRSYCRFCHVLVHMFLGKKWDKKVWLDTPLIWSWWKYPQNNMRQSITKPTIRPPCRDTNSVVTTICTFVICSEVVLDAVLVQKRVFPFRSSITFQWKILTLGAVGGA